MIEALYGDQDSALEQTFSPLESAAEARGMGAVEAEAQWFRKSRGEIRIYADVTA